MFVWIEHEATHDSKNSVTAVALPKLVYVILTGFNRRPTYSSHINYFYSISLSYSFFERTG